MLLSVRDLTAGYGNKTVVHGASLDVGDREVVVVIGPNGAGKSTLLHAIFGILPPRGGRIMWDGVDLAGMAPSARTNAGIAYGPQGAQIYPSLTVAENLTLGAYSIKDRLTARENIEHAYRLFPILQERRKLLASTLSGGERQMLSFGALLAAKPKLILLDEPSGGLAPLMVNKVFDTISTLVDEMGISLLLIEQNVTAAFSLARRAYVMAQGRIVAEGKPEELEKESRLSERYFGTSSAQ